MQNGRSYFGALHNGTAWDVITTKVASQGLAMSAILVYAQGITNDITAQHAIIQRAVVMPSDDQPDPVE